MIKVCKDLMDKKKYHSGIEKLTFDAMKFNINKMTKVIFYLFGDVLFAFHYGKHFFIDLWWNVTWFSIFFDLQDTYWNMILKLKLIYKGGHKWICFIAKR